MTRPFHFPSFLLTSLALSTGTGIGRAEEVKLPVDSSEKGIVYVAPTVKPTETSATATGAAVGVQRPDGSGLKAGVDRSGERPTYSLEAETGGKTSFSAGAQSDGKSNNGVKAGITIKY